MSLRQAVDGYRVMHQCTKDYIHSVIFRGDNNREIKCEPFEPSMFIYAFFAYNTFYNINWLEALKNNKVERFNHKTATENEQSEALFKFLCSNFISPSERASKFRNTYKACIEKYLESINEGEQELFDDWTNDMMEDIEPDCDCGNPLDPDEIIAPFRYTISSLLDPGNELNEADLISINNLIYPVRCNLFHGAKGAAGVLEESNQRKRFAMYSAILIAINELLFYTLDRLLGKNRQ